MIEGPRGSGKTTLTQEFFKLNQNPKTKHYKFSLSDYVKKFEIGSKEEEKSLHYFSISNILTILEISGTFLKDLNVVFDRSIFSAYVWSIYQDRLPKKRLMSEFDKILSSEIYRDCKLIYVTKSDPDFKISRDKADVFSQFEDYGAEKRVYDEVLGHFKSLTYNPNSGNEYYEFQNDFNQESIISFNKLLTGILDK